MIQQRCPICEGHGIVQAGFYNITAGQEAWSSSTSEQCRNCLGRGIVYVTNQLSTDVRHGRNPSRERTVDEDYEEEDIEDISNESLNNRIKRLEERIYSLERLIDGSRKGV